MQNIKPLQNVMSVMRRKIRAYNALDFDDLIMLPTLLFKQNAEVRSKMAGENPLFVGG